MCRLINGASASGESRERRGGGEAERGSEGQLYYPLGTRTLTRAPTSRHSPKVNARVHCRGPRAAPAPGAWRGARGAAPAPGARAFARAARGRGGRAGAGRARVRRGCARVYVSYRARTTPLYT